ncbi:hypothetical protein BJ978_001763 [Agromyces terreus]|uniref:Uncharacterized protein n=1 Tax=Agromyces terreus TaxID=424795 RepID=A0A9X2H5C6_9MICO|nr:hypothetical protein [Agromyces terreus]MCP2371087.1 hypothetical protein [Agromyces terreus]
MNLDTRVRPARDDERGAALLTVLGISLVLLILIAIGASWSLAGLRKAATDNDTSAALAAAYAGADEYTSRLSNDASYFRYGNPASAFSTASGSSVALPVPPAKPANPAFNVAAGAPWASVAGSGGRASFRYEVDNSNFDRTGVIRVRSTGKVGTAVRSIIVSIKQKGFIDYLWYTDYEFGDPMYNTGTCSPIRHDWEGGRPPGCVDIQFRNEDEMNGPAHSDDRMLICGGSDWNGSVTTADPRTPNYSSCGSGTPNFNQGAPVSTSTVGMPPTNQEMENETRVDLPDTVARPGCLYTGPTVITFNSGGTMTVISPWTRVTQPSYTTGIASQSPNTCGRIADLNSYAGATIPVLDQNLIYVQDVPSATGPADPNRPTSTSYLPPRFTCVGSGRTSGWQFRQGTNAWPRIGFPYFGNTTASTETIPASPVSTDANPSYDCRRGDVFVRGDLKGAVTISATVVYITGDLKYVPSTDSILGLVGQNSVWVWNPMRSSTAINPYGTGNRRIDAAMISVAHVFQVQNYSVGSKRGDLIVNGAIAQKFRGIVYNGGGYDKDYNYDTRFKTIAPPKFLTPTSTTYGVTQFSSTAPAFTSTGAPN